MRTVDERGVRFMKKNVFESVETLEVVDQREEVDIRRRVCAKVVLKVVKVGNK